MLLSVHRTVSSQLAYTLFSVFMFTSQHFCSCLGQSFPNCLRYGNSTAPALRWHELDPQPRISSEWDTCSFPHPRWPHWSVSMSFLQAVQRVCPCTSQFFVLNFVFWYVGDVFEQDYDMLTLRKHATDPEFLSIFKEGIALYLAGMCAFLTIECIELVFVEVELKRINCYFYFLISYLLIIVYFFRRLGHRARLSRTQQHLHERNLPYPRWGRPLPDLAALHGESKLRSACELERVSTLDCQVNSLLFSIILCLSCKNNNLFRLDV